MYLPVSSRKDAYPLSAVLYRPFRCCLPEPVKERKFLHVVFRCCSVFRSVALWMKLLELNEEDETQRRDSRQFCSKIDHEVGAVTRILVEKRSRRFQWTPLLRNLEQSTTDCGRGIIVAIAGVL